MSARFAFLKSIFSHQKGNEKEENEKIKKKGGEKKNDRFQLKGFKANHPIPLIGLAEEISRSMRDVPPAHYTMKLSSLSYLLDQPSSSIVSNVFEVDGYKWRLCVYPGGNKKRNGSNHLSLYLAVAETDSFPPGWEVHATFKFLLFDQIRDKYLTIKDAGGRGRCFHEMNTEWGFTQALPLIEFRDPSKGYIVENSCTLGVEVFVSKRTRNGENVTLIWEPLHTKEAYSWEIKKFSILDKEFHYSDVFTLRENNWKLKLYPRGQNGKGKDLSVFLEPQEFKTHLPGGKQLVIFMLRVKDQKHSKHMEKRGVAWFSGGDDSVKDWGFQKFMPLNDLIDPSEGSLINDAFTIEVQIVATSTVEYFS